MNETPGRLSALEPPHGYGADWPMREWLLALLGAAAGLSFYFLVKGPENVPWRMALATFVVAAPLTAGLTQVRGEIVFVLDADLQDPPELLGPMLEKVRAGYDVVYGQRIKRHGETAFKRGTAALFYRMLGSMVDTPIPRDTGDFRLMTRRVVDQLNAMPERYRFIRGLVSFVGFNQIAFPYERDARLVGETNYPLSKMVALAIDAVTSFSVVPLRFASHLGMLFGIAGLVSLIWVVGVWMQGGTVQGWASLAALILIMGSVQLLVLGVFGEYLGRMYMEAKRRPLFIISEVRRHPVAVQDETAGPEYEARADLLGGIRVAS
jgi:dolichol-phosphate mannosyltransferase